MQLPTNKNLLTFVVLVLLLVSFARSATATTYFLSSSSGNDSNVGTDPNTPWKSLKKASTAKLNPGDKLLFRSGDEFEGMLWIDAKGEPNHTINIESYGDGVAPLIDGNGEEACIRLVNPAFIVVRNLELKNPGGFYGIRMTAEDSGRLQNVLVEQLKIHDVFDRAWSFPESPGHGEYKQYGGINAEVLSSKTPSWWDGVVIRNCDIHHLGSCGINVGSDFPLHELRRSQRGTDANPIQGVVIERNIIHDIARDGAMIRQCVQAIVQHNEVKHTGSVSMSNGIWFWDCEDCTMRFNVGFECGVKGRSDGSPFSIDSYCQGCVIECNYAHDNEGPGFMVFGTKKTARGSIVRGNLSYNDATAESKPGFASLSIVSEVTDAIIEDNIVIAGPDTRVLLAHREWNGLPIGVTYRRNVIVGNGQATIDESVLRGGHFEGNLFLNTPDLPDGVGTTQGDAGRVFMEAMSKARAIRREACDNP